MTFRHQILNPRYGKFGMIIMPAHFMMLVVLPFFFLSSIVGIVLSLLTNPTNYLLAGAVVLGVLFTLAVNKLKAFLKIQASLVLVLSRFIFGIDTQKFERLKSVRP